MALADRHHSLNDAVNFQVQTFHVIRSTVVPTLLGLSTALAACGGGKSSPAQFDLQTGIARLVSQELMFNVGLSGSVMINGSSVPITGGGTVTLSPASATFDNTMASAQTQSIVGTVTTANGQNMPISINTVDYYATSNQAFLGEVKSGTSAEYDVAATPIDFPTSIVPGSAGTLGAFSRYTDNTMSVSLGTAQLSYSVPQSTVEPGEPLQVDLTTTFYDTTNALVETDTLVFNLSSNSAATFVSAESQTPSATLVAIPPAP